MKDIPNWKEIVEHLLSLDKRNAVHINRHRIKFLMCHTMFLKRFANAPIYQKEQRLFISELTNLFPNIEILWHSHKNIEIKAKK